MSGKSRYVTVLHQLKESENGEPGDLTVIHGKRLDDSYAIDDDSEGFVPLRRPIAVIDVGVEITEEEVTEWCNSHAGRAVLQRYWPELEVEDPTLPDCEEYLQTEAEPEPVPDGGALHTNPAEQWRRQAADNVGQWGQQEPLELLLAIAEELAEINQAALLNAEFEDSPAALRAKRALSKLRDEGLAARTFLETYYERNGEPVPHEDRPELGGLVDVEAVREELDDLGALLLQLDAVLQETQS